MVLSKRVHSPEAGVTATSTARGHAPQARPHPAGPEWRRGPAGRRSALVAAALTATLAIAACGSSSSSSSSSTSSSPTQGSASTAAASSTPAQGANLSAAAAAIAPYSGHPSAFPVTTPLGKHLAPGTKFVYLQCSTPVCAQIGQLLAPAVKTIGASLTVINSGSTASSSQTAASSALALKPAAVMIPAVTPSEFGTSLKQLDAAGIKVTSVGVIGGAAYGITYGIGGLGSTRTAGKLMADWVIVHKGAKANVVFYTTPELDFSAPMLMSFKQELHTNCPSCTLRTVPISVSTFGSTAPQTVANDLQAHASTNVAVFASMEAATGLPAALESAGLKITTLGFAPDPGNLQDIKSGQLTAGLGLDTPVQEWTQVDATARLVLGEHLAPSEANVDLEFLGQKQITFNPSMGWTGYPDFAERFAKLWGAAK
jgi:ribose transport system substrate-binding protein